MNGLVEGRRPRPGGENPGEGGGWWGEEGRQGRGSPRRDVEATLRLQCAEAGGPPRFVEPVRGAPSAWSAFPFSRTGR